MKYCSSCMKRPATVKVGSRNYCEQCKADRDVAMKRIKSVRMS